MRSLTPPKSRRHGDGRIWPNRIWPIVQRIWLDQIWPKLVFCCLGRIWPNLCLNVFCRYSESLNPEDLEPNTHTLKPKHQTSISRVFVKTSPAFGRRRFHEKSQTLLFVPLPITCVVFFHLVVCFFQSVLCFMVGQNTKTPILAKFGSAQYCQLRLAKFGKLMLARFGLGQIRNGRIRSNKDRQIRFGQIRHRPQTSVHSAGVTLGSHTGRCPRPENGMRVFWKTLRRC